MTKNITTKALMAAFLCYFFWGFSFMFSKITLQYASPLIVLALRFFISFIVVNIFMLTGKFKLRLKGKKVGTLLLLGLFEPILYFYFEHYGLLNASSSFSGVMIALIPVVTLIFSSVFLKEKPSKGQVIFSIISISGVIILALIDTAGGSTNLLGILLLLGAILAGTGFNIISRGSSKEFTSFERTYVMILTGVVMFTATAIIENINDLGAIIRPLSVPSFSGSILYLGIVSSACGYMLLNYANTHLPLARSTAFANLTTAVTVFAGVVFLHEKFNYISAFATIIILLGIWGIQKNAAKDDGNSFSVKAKFAKHSSL